VIDEAGGAGVVVPLLVGLLIGLESWLAEAVASASLRDVTECT
jgi:hypothetical protein